MKRIYLALLLASSAFTGGCGLLGGDDEEETRSEILASGEWRLISFVSQTGTQPARSLIEACDEDDFFRFLEDKSYAEERNQRICSNATNFPPVALGTWSQTGDVETITITNSTSAGGMVLVGTWQVTELNNNSLRLTATTTVSGSTRVSTVEMRHQ
ncbi:hypothetical protein MTX78_01700 [Hymenobacter tibetensis]|uniref:Lipocalin-like domain-containing protein n=1 Tax=Hymenobacter tibetensis TaxID=497967 RepID=A0ABY4D0E8_9BACT|nr:hypothetical protein [Hymenobacter tibetensis]UOG75324.1 hypothetical protein MTX78_01700 [Hymenobacter tibetensis]